MLCILFFFNVFSIVPNYVYIYIGVCIHIYIYAVSIYEDIHGYGSK